MRLSHLLKGLYHLPEELDRDVAGLVLDSRQVKSGDVFFACHGTQQDGRLYIADAIANGAVAIVAEAESDQVSFLKNIPVIPVNNLNHQISQIAASFYGYPADKLKIIGVTGTTGKTSTSYFIAAALQQFDISCGIIGSLGSGVFGNIEPGNLTTPDAITLQATLAKFVEAKIQIVAMEVSSHSIDQGRINAIAYEVAVYTNLSRDHLDYHGDMETYGAVKKRFLESPRVANSIVNADDEFGKKIIEALRGHKTFYTYSTHAENDVRASNIHFSGTGIQAEITSPWGSGKLTTGLVGEFNLSNLLAVISGLCLLDIPFDKVLSSIATLKSVPGRMEMIGGEDQPLVIVDYAHKPDALEKVLHTLRKHCQGTLYCIFGCGGERDKGKRPMMAKIAEQLADKVVVTDDNPRHEDPAEIVADILKGFSNPEKIIVQHDRSKAIKDIIQSAAAGDCILVAGKGAETYQQRGDKKIPLDDAEIVKQYLSFLSLV